MRDGRRILDCDAHQMEPGGIWRDYIDPAFRDEAPRLAKAGARSTIMVEGQSLTAEEGKYPFASPQFLAALTRGMQRFKKAREAGFPYLAVLWYDVQFA